MAIRIELDRVVKLVYRIVDGAGRVLEDRSPENPYEYLHGRGQIVGPVERAVEGKTAGFQAEVQVTPREGFGEYDPSLVVEIPRSRFPAGVDVRADMKFNTMGPSGSMITVRVVEVDDETVTVDGNHPLAGVAVVFDLRVLDVREASADEIESGRVGVGPVAKGSSSLH